ncbi:MAG TPA: FAD-dependent oxidoreductase [Woeseiaceae bacterium]|nr:FAD-dependent oxidoreductase [Woeseiaceae bacterium]
MKKRVLVLGAGVTGVVTAWYLTQKGHDVTVVEASDSVASGTSRANAGQLSYSFTDAVARPEFLRKMPALLAGKDAGSLVRLKPDAAFLRWGRQFLRQCTKVRARDNTFAVLEVAMRSAALMERLMQAVPLEFDFARAGKLVLLSLPDEVARARKSVLLKREYGCVTEVVTRSEALELEPALAEMRGDFIAATYSRDDHVADARKFTEGLADWLQREIPVQFRLRETVARLVVEDNRVRGVVTDRGDYTADSVVVCLGTGSTKLLEPHRIDPAICPVRGYSITLPPGPHAPSASISDLKHRIVLSKLGPVIRIAGFADFVGHETRHDDARLDSLVEIARRVAPLAADYDAGDMQRWGGVRPMTPDGRPRVGRTAIGGLFLNTGHGMLGFTLACATGEAVAEEVTSAP